MPLSKPDLMTGGLWQKLDSTTVPNAKNVLKGIQTSDFQYALPRLAGASGLRQHKDSG